MIKNKELKPRVYVVDDDSGVTDGLEWLLGSINIDTIICNSAVEFLNRYDDTAPSCLVLDLRMPEMSGAELFDEINKRGHQIPVIFLSAHADVPIVVNVMKMGAVDFIQKPFNPHQFLDLINNVLRTAKDNWSEVHNQREMEILISSLTNREKEVLKILIQGKNNKQIGKVLSISYKTVEVHRANIMRKLNVQSYAELLSNISRLDINIRNIINT